MNVLVREFREQDRGALRLLYMVARKNTSVWNDVDRHQPGDFDHDTQGEKILVAAVDAEVVGFASVWEPDSFLHNLFVHPSLTRKGVGQALLAQCDRYFRSAPTLKCLTRNNRAIVFYNSQGWEVLREEIGPDGPYLLMTKARVLKPT